MSVQGGMRVGREKFRTTKEDIVCECDIKHLQTIVSDGPLSCDVVTSLKPNAKLIHTSVRHIRYQF